MSRYAYSIAAAVLLVALMASHWKAYVMGANSVRVQMQAQALKASEEARAKEHSLASKVESLDRDLQKQKARNADLSRALADRLREYEAALGRASESAAASSAVASPFAAIAGECARYLAAMDDHARGLAATAAGLQRYAAEVSVGK